MLTDDFSSTGTRLDSDPEGNSAIFLIEFEHASPIRFPYQLRQETGQNLHDKHRNDR